MTLGGLRGASNTLLAYQSPDDDTAAITAPPMLIEWFKKAGFVLKETFVRNSIYNHQLINEYVKRPNHYVVSLVDSAIIDNMRKVKPNAPNHWIMWSSPLTHFGGGIIHDNTKDSNKVAMTCFSWGEHDKKYAPIVLIKSLKPCTILAIFLRNRHHYDYQISVFRNFDTCPNRLCKSQFLSRHFTPRLPKSAI